MIIPPAIIFVNNDLTDNVKDKLSRQLFINQTLDGYVWDNYVTLDPTYPDRLRLLNQRVLVIRSFDEFVDRGSNDLWTTADVVIFIKTGLAYVLVNKFGPPGATFSVANLYWGHLGIF